MGKTENSLAVLNVIGYNLKHLAQTLRKRSYVQEKIRTISDKAYLSGVCGFRGGAITSSFLPV